jgi:hypothetical protein
MLLSRTAVTWLLLLVTGPTIAGAVEEDRHSHADLGNPAFTRERGPSGMNQREVLLRSLEYFPADSAEQEAFVARHEEEARFAARVAAEAWRSDDRRLVAASELFLRALDDLAIRPLLEIAVPTDASDAAAYVGMLVQPEIALRAAIATRIDSMLEDRRPVPASLPPGPEPEESPAQRRVCDEAYLAMQSMVNFGEDRLELVLDQRAFLSEPPEARDVLIGRARDSAAWQRALGDDPD